MRLFPVFVAALSGFQFGFNTSIIAGALLFLKTAFSLDPLTEGFAVSIILIGALAGAMMGGFFAHRLGRKKTMQISTLVFIIACSAAAFAPTFALFLFARAITGWAIGLISVAAPLYLAEIAPSKVRGRYVSSYQLAITLGILFAYALGYFYAASGKWQAMIIWGIAPALLQGVLLFFIPESPDFLHLKENKHKSSWRALFLPKYRKVLWIGLILSIFQQITGINAVTYFAPKIFQIAGYKTAIDATFATLGLGIINVAATLLSLWLIDKAGRRKLLFAGLAGMSASLFFLSFEFYSAQHALQSVSLLSLLAYMASFAIAMGPIPWIILSEIYPLAIRGPAMGFAIFFNWFFNYVVTLTFLPASEALKPAGIFAIYGFFSVLCLGFVWKFIPETKGKSLEEIEKKLTG